MTEPRALCLLGKHSASQATFLPRTFLPWLECNCSQRNKYLLVHACNSSTGETEAGGLRQVSASTVSTTQRRNCPASLSSFPPCCVVPGALCSAVSPALTRAPRALLLCAHVLRGLPLPQLHLSRAAVEIAEGRAVVAGLRLHPLPDTCSPRCPPLTFL